MRNDITKACRLESAVFDPAVLPATTVTCLAEETTNIQSQPCEAVTRQELDALRVAIERIGATLKAHEVLPGKPTHPSPTTSNAEAAQPPGLAMPEVGLACPRDPLGSTVTRKAKGGKKKKKISLAAQEAEVQNSPCIHTLTAPAKSQSWTTVVKKSVARKQVPQAKTATLRMTPKDLVVPRTSAIVLTLRQEAIDRGVDYQKVLEVARDKLNTTSLGIPFLKISETATGARKLIVPGAASAENADRLAEKLKTVLAESLGAEMVTLFRPTKSCELRITGLDDAATKAEIASAVATKGNCPVDQVKVGEVRRTAYGARTAWVRCPVAAGKKVAIERNLLLGWLAVQVHLLQPQGKRCFRCLQPGHIKQRCHSGIDRSDLCFRCSKNGHKAVDCMATPHCSICADSNRPANHRLASCTCTKLMGRQTKPGKETKERPGTHTESPVHATPPRPDTGQDNIP